MKQRIYRILGKALCRLTVLRNMAWEMALREKFGSIHPSTVLEYPLKVSNPECIQIGPGARISWGGKLFAMTEYLDQRFDPEILIGDNCYVGNHVHIVATRRVAIGKNVMLADRVHLSDHVHDYRNVGASIIENERIRFGEVHIGDDSWIGENVSIVGDIRIGQHCVVGANAVVTQSLPAFSVAVGVPARVIKRYNFSTEQWETADQGGSSLGMASGSYRGMSPYPEEFDFDRQSPS